MKVWNLFFDFVFVILIFQVLDIGNEVGELGFGNRYQTKSLEKVVMLGFLRSKTSKLQVTIGVQVQGVT